MPDRWTDLGTFIRSQREMARLSLRRMSEIAGISNPYLSQIERGLRKPSAEILQQIAKALRISAETLYVRAGILDDHRDMHADLVGHIYAATDIDDQQKQVLIAIYLSFRGHSEDGPAAGPLETDAGPGDGASGSSGAGDENGTH
jgi:transcriptional regulator with XRE-family HTH domain